MASSTHLASVIFCICSLIYKSDGACEVNGKTYNIGEVWQEASQHPDCFQHVCLQDGTFTTSKCDPSHNDIEVEPVVELETTVSFTDSGKALTTTELFFDNQDSEGGCTVDDRVVKVGEQVDVPGRCYYRACAGDNQWIMKACGLIGLVPGWILTPEDTSKPYPDCCGRGAPLLDIIPDVIQGLQWSVALKMSYENNTVDYGNELTPRQVKSEPVVNYTVNPNSSFLLSMVDPDAQSHQNPEPREFLHWLVGNIQGDDVTSGDVLAEYVGSAPPKGSGLHRYVFLLYKQPGNVTFEEPILNNTSIEGRSNFSISQFAQKYNFSNPIALNFFVAQYDDYVPEVYKQLGIESD